MISVTEAAKELGVTTGCLYNWSKNGKFIIIEEGYHKRFIDDKDFEILKKEKLPKGYKKCRDCGKTDQKEQFPPNRMLCVECYRKFQNDKRDRRGFIYNKNRRDKYHQNPYKYKSKSKQAKYGITQEEFDKMKESVNNACEICKSQNVTLCLDHDHNTNKIRGIICHKCNLGLGNLRDSYEIVKSAADYLNKNEPSYHNVCFDDPTYYSD
jgi:protein-arginine kinase activator protein McsA